MSSTTPETNVVDTSAAVPETTTTAPTTEAVNAPAPAAPAAAAAAAAPEDDEQHDDNECETVSENIHQRVITTELGEMTELESMCPSCEDNGITRLMITNIPHFRQVIVSSFSCEHCGERNTEIQFGGTFGAKRTRHELKVQKQEDMNRQIVKSEYATLCIPELELELPRETQTGSLNTVEGILVKTIEGLQAQQVLRRIQHPEVAQQIDEYCAKLESYRDGSKKFTITIDDPSGNSHIEPYYDYYHPTIDPQLSRQEFVRTDEERQLLGLAVEGAGAAAAPEEEDLGLPAPPATSSITHPVPAMTPAKKAEIAKAAAALLHGAEYNKGRTDAEEHNVDEGILDNVFEMPELCPACRAPQVLKMHKVDIPYFKSTIIMAFKCDMCGYKSTEIKSGGEISARGKRITLRVENDEDMKRDLLKSNTAALSIPELDVELVPGTLGGFFTTVEGLLTQIHTNLKSTPTTDFAKGDSAAVNPRYSANSNQELQTSMKSFLDKLQDTIDGKNYPFTLILDDPLADIYIQNSRAHLPPPNNVDPQLTIEDYVRTEEQDDDLGLLDMNVDQKEE